MVKWILGGSFLALSASCASTQSTSPAPVISVLYSGYFRLSLHTSILEGGKILGADGPSVFMKNGNSLSGLVITKDLEGLPADFDLRSYPLYVLDLVKADKIDSALKSKFENSHRGLFQSLEVPRITKASGEGYALHSACNGLECVSFVIQDKQNEQILMLSTTGYTIVDLQKAIEGASNADQSRAG